MAPRFVLRFVVSALSFVTLSGGVQAAPKIGVASAVKNQVERVVGGGGQPLSIGSEVFTNERIRTGEASAAQILFLDKTSLTVGPRAEVTLDRFVYNPSTGAGQVVLNAVRGSFRFITGSQTPRNYLVKTPVGSIGIRGTIVDLSIGNGQVTVILVEGSVTFTLNGISYTLSKPGTRMSFPLTALCRGQSLGMAQSSIRAAMWHFHFSVGPSRARRPSTGCPMSISAQ